MKQIVSRIETKPAIVGTSVILEYATPILSYIYGFPLLVFLMYQGSLSFNMQIS